MRTIKSKLSRGNVGLVILLALAFIVIVSAVGVKVWYSHNLGPVSSATTTQYFTISSGTSVHQIAGNLQQASLVKNAGVFETYVRSKGYSNKLQAGTYLLSPSMGVEQIVKKMVAGDVAKNLLTILPGKRLDDIKKAFLKAGYSQADVDAAFDSTKYASHPALASLPPGATLEGYLYPDSFQKQNDTPASTIVTESLDQMQKKLTADITSGFAAQGLSVFQGITLASIVVQETGDTASQPIVAQVFLSRLKQNMALQSDVTAYYAAAIIGTSPSVNVDSPYNTYLHTGLPPGPISNVTASALKAVAHPASTDYLYFVAGDDGKIYFSHTAQEHQDAVHKYCHNACLQ